MSVSAHRTGLRGNRWRYGWLFELALLAAFYELYNVVQGSLTGSAGVAQRDGRLLLRCERLLHLDPEHFLNQGLGRLPVLAVLACYFYVTLHFIVTPAVLMWVYRARPDSYRPVRAVLGLMTLSALLGFWLFPVAPPRLLAGAGFTDTVAQFSAWGWWSSDALPAAANALENPYAAMPSLHVAWATWAGGTIFLLSRRTVVRALAVAYPALTTLVVLSTANHYLADVVLGAALWVAALMAVRGVASLRRRARPTGRRDRRDRRLRAVFDPRQEPPSFRNASGEIVAQHALEGPSVRR